MTNMKALIGSAPFRRAVVAAASTLALLVLMAGGVDNHAAAHDLHSAQAHILTTG